MAERFDALMARAAACTLCAQYLEAGCRPVLQAHPAARLLVVSQAPGRRVHETGVPFDDPSGDKLREWMGVDKTTFHDARRVAIVPMAFCYPGKGKSGDLPPRKECAPLWHPQIVPRLTQLQLTLAVGSYAIRGLLGKRARSTLTETCEAWRGYFEQGLLPLPHPSPRNVGWFQKHPWFEAETVPVLRDAVRRALGG